ncbi:MAG TPA: hypothetical protein VKI44_25595 [Acetobacteraceae bacterium]|nr:hypothetical protein [Acetobacteraceae bacterium]
MRLSRGWCALLLFWAGVVSLCGIGAGTLQVLGSPSPEARPAQENHADLTPVEFASVLPLTSPAVLPAADLAVEASGHLEASAPNAQDVSPGPVAMAASEPTAAANEGAKPEAPLPEKKLHLRIVRDSKLCPTTTCYRWRLINQRSKAPRAATIDLAQLHLAPSLREAVENGDVQLLVDAVEHHKMINGRDVVIIVATSLTGVTPHDTPP